MIKIKHNLDANKFKWLWCKYVQAGNDEKHCTNSLKGKYSKKFSKHNENFIEEWTIEIEDGMISIIPEIEELPEKYQDLPEQYVTCRIFRWAIGYFFS